MVFGKDKMKKMSENEKKAKMSVLKDLHGQASGMMKDGLKKVTVASDSKEGLKKGLDKAEDMLGEQSEEECEYCGTEGCPHCALGEKEQDQAEGYEDQQDESMPMDEDELDAEIERLMQIRSKLQK